MKEFIDASLFLGMHSSEEVLRIACKNYFVDRYTRSLGMSDDQAGKCDRIIWKYSRELQDIYYPFMDRLRTDMDIQGLEYESQDLNVSQTERRLDGLRISQKLTLGMVIARTGKLFTIDTTIHKMNLELNRQNKLAIYFPELGWEKRFPEPMLEKCYQKSLALRIAPHLLENSVEWQQNLARKFLLCS